MKVLIFLLLLHLIEIASQCPTTGEITKNELDQALFVAKIQVVGERLPRDKFYYLYDIHYSDFYFSYHDIDHTKRYAPKVLGLDAHCSPLVNGTSYVLGCWRYDTHRCRIVREFDKLTEEEKERIKSMISSAWFYYLGWYSY